jgi:hypothetical protein
MSLVDVHIELSHHAFFEELVKELCDVIEKKKTILEKSKAEDVKNLEGDAKKAYMALEKRENELIAEFIKNKQRFELPDDAFDKFAEEIGYAKKTSNEK